MHTKDKEGKTAAQLVREKWASRAAATQKTAQEDRQPGQVSAEWLMHTKDKEGKTAAQLVREKWASRAAATQKTAQEDRQPGQVSATLRRRMGPALADVFDTFGPEIYSDISLSLKDSILEKFKSGFESLENAIKEELGRRGVDESKQHVQAWINEIVEDVVHSGMDEAADALEDLAGTLSAEYIQEEEGEEGDELFGVDVLDDEDVEEVEEVEEEPEEETEEEAPEEVASEDVEEITLDDIGTPEE